MIAGTAIANGIKATQIRNREPLNISRIAAATSSVARIRVFRSC
jgi:hypothetical protein